MKKLLTIACLYVVTAVAIISFIAPFATAQDAKQSGSDADAFVAWAARNAVPIKTMEPRRTSDEALGP